jgi:hypothetical protein
MARVFRSPHVLLQDICFQLLSCRRFAINAPHDVQAMFFCFFAIKSSIFRKIMTHFFYSQSVIIGFHPCNMQRKQLWERVLPIGIRSTTLSKKKDAII